MLVNKLSHDTVLLPPGQDQTGDLDECGVAFDDEGFGVVASEDFSADIDDLLPTLVFEDPAGAIYFVKKSGMHETVEALAEIELRFQYKKVAVALMGTLKLEFPVVHFERARADGCHILWDMLNFFKVLKLPMMTGQAHTCT